MKGAADDAQPRTAWRAAVASGSNVCCSCPAKDSSTAENAAVPAAAVP